jgi:AhpD family alkylhydroperoxidase
MTDVREMEWAECLVEARPDPELSRELRRALGFPQPGLEYLTSCPWMARWGATINLNHRTLVHTSPDLFDLIFMAVSQDNSCRFCYGGRETFLRIMGFGAERIRQLEETFFASDLDERDLRAIDFAKRVSHANPLPTDADKQSLRDVGYDEEAIRELVFAAASVTAANRTATLIALPPEKVEGLSERWYIRLARPLLAARLRSLREPGERSLLSAEEKIGPFSDIVLALDGLPVARSLRHLIDSAWESTILPRRTKALIFAVIARGLGCQRSEQEARRLLADEGLCQEKSEECLTHLGSSDLSAIENAIAPFARETIRYRTVQIQRRARTLRGELSLDEFVEVVGLVALANLVCRLGVMIDDGP